MVRTRGSEGRAHAERVAQSLDAAERKWKRAATAVGGQKKPCVANDTTRKWIPLAVSVDELDQLVADKSMTANLLHRILDGEAPPAHNTGEHVLH